MAPQSYFLGGKIRASDFNNFADDINEIVGLGAGDSGYGQDQLIVSYVAAGAKIRAANWDELLTSIRFAAQHQNTNINIPTSTSDPDWPGINNAIRIVPNLVTDIANVRSNKINYSISKMSIDVNKISSSRYYSEPVDPANPTENNWLNTKFYEFKVTFADEDARRNFFNAGGEIRISSEFSNYGTDDQEPYYPQSDSWNQLLSSISTIRLGINTTEASVGATGNGFHQLTTTYQTVYQKVNTATDYSDNKLMLEAKISNSPSYSVDLKLSFVDGHIADSGTWSFPPDSGSWTGTDYVVGTLSIQVDQQRADDNDASNMGVVSPSPTYSHISEL